MLGSRQITTFELWKLKAIAQQGTLTSPVIDLREIVGLYKFSAHGIVAGTGNVDIEAQYCSTKDRTFVSESTLIADDQAAGTFFADFSPDLTPFMKIKVTENNGGPITALSLWLNIA